MKNTRQQSQFSKLASEYIILKNKIFGNYKFVVLDDNDIEHKRYSQLFQYLYPQFRTKDFINPIN